MEASSTTTNGTKQPEAIDAMPEALRLVGYVDPSGPDDDADDFEAAIAHVKEYMSVAAAVLAKLHGDLTNIDEVVPRPGEPDEALARGTYALYQAARHVEVLLAYRDDGHSTEPRGAAGQKTEPAPATTAPDANYAEHLSADLDDLDAALIVIAGASSPRLVAAIGRAQKAAANLRDTAAHLRADAMDREVAQ